MMESVTAMMGSEVEGSSSDENGGADSSTQSPLGADTKLMIEVLKEVSSFINLIFSFSSYQKINI